MSRTVVIGLDRSDLSARALPFAQQIAQQWRGRLVLVHAVVNQDDQAPIPVEFELRSTVRELNRLGVTADAVVRHGSPAQAITDVATESQADLIVMASHQRRGLDRWLRGSITEEVLARTRGPLLVIPRQGARAIRSSTRILVPLDGSPTGEAALDFLRGRSTTGPIEVLLVRVVSYSPVVLGLDATFNVQTLTPSELAADVRQAREYLTRLTDSIADAKVIVRHQVIEAADAVAKVILETARQEEADLIALGTHAKTGVSRLVLGSVSEEVLETSSLPVLLVHQVQARRASAPHELRRNSAIPTAGTTPWARPDHRWFARGHHQQRRSPAHAHSS